MSAAKIIQRFGDDGACIWQAGKNFACGWVYQSPMYLKWFDSPQAARMAWEIIKPQRSWAAMAEQLRPGITALYTNESFAAGYLVGEFK